MLLSIFSLLLSVASAAVIVDRQTLGQASVCKQIASNITGKVYYTLSVNYATDIEHFMTSSTQAPLCVVEVESIQDVSNVMKIIASTRTPFAIKSGGHASNPGFSSTTGVHISLVKLNQVTLNADKSLVEIGTGNVSLVPQQ